MKQDIPLQFEEPLVTPSLHTPSYLRRTTALLIDIGILGLTLFSPFSSLLEKNIPKGDFKTVYSAISLQTTTTAIFYVALFFIFVLMLLYFALCEYFIGQTAGKRLMNLKVEDYNKKTPTFMQCLIRNLHFILLFPLWILLFVEPIYLAVTKQRVLEQLSKTRTVNYMNKEKTEMFLS